MFFLGVGLGRIYIYLTFNMSKYPSRVLQQIVSRQVQHTKTNWTHSDLRF